MNHFNEQRTRKYLREFDFRSLFIEELGWDNYRANLIVPVDGTAYPLQAVAEKRGLVVFVHWAEDEDEIPDHAVRNKIEREVAKSHQEHMLIFVDGQRTRQMWLWVRRELGRPLARRTVEYRPDHQSGTLLIQKLQAVAFSFEEEEDLTLVDVTSRVRAAFNVERATKKFYDQFKKEREAFEKFVLGIPDVDMSKWYVSVMLNRLMFVYFIQRKGFLDNDPDYLRNRMRRMQERYGSDQFYSFYRYFLLRLFHDGLGKPDHDPELEALIGKVPYLNGGIFQIHEVEERYPDIQISDQAFERIFKFFDQYQWHLDDRPLRDDREINPDVLGYIFEKYINQKQMGAYYTKEDITEYISKNTIVPFLFDEAQKECAIAFSGEQAVWRLAQADPDRYIYPAVRHGNQHELPQEIAAGIADVGRRGAWNTPTPEEYGLPTEIWRETVARRQRYEEVCGKLAAGEVTSINDFITYNLDIQQFAQDVIENSEGPELLRAFWKALNQVSVLDPTCGSGAFLFAALNILQPLYEACLTRMEAFVGELTAEDHPQKYHDFKRTLQQVAQHPNQTYYVLKSIVVNNLYGVDIMAEAVEIAKLRLFLKLVAQVETVAQIEPLPDIDFNIRAGNTLVGFTTKEEVRRAMQIKQVGEIVQQRRILFGEDESALGAIETKAADVDRLFSKFREMQTTGDLADFDAADFVETKQQVEGRLRALEEELNRYLARQYGVDPDKPAAYRQWLTSHQPFHWFTEFYGILKQGGFDVIIGNPPYVTYGKSFGYELRDFVTEECKDLYSFVMERSINILKQHGRMGMIIPISCVSTDGFSSLRTFLLSNLAASWISNFAERPSKLFSGVEKRLTIWLGKAIKNSTGRTTFLSKYKRWLSDERVVLFETIEFTSLDGVPRLVNDSLPKISTSLEKTISTKLQLERPLEYYFKRTANPTVYYTRKLRYFVQFFDFIPEIRSDSGSLIPPSELKQFRFSTTVQRDAALALLNSNLFFWFLTVHSDVRNVNKREIETFRCSLDKLDGTTLNHLTSIARKLMIDFKENSRVITNNYKKHGVLHIQSFQPRLSKSIIDEIDSAMAAYYDLTDEELDFIINYDIKYRMGDELFEEEEEA